VPNRHFHPYRTGRSSRRIPVDFPGSLDLRRGAEEILLSGERGRERPGDLEREGGGSGRGPGGKGGGGGGCQVESEAVSGLPVCWRRPSASAAALPSHMYARPQQARSGPAWGLSLPFAGPARAASPSLHAASLPSPSFQVASLRLASTGRFLLHARPGGPERQPEPRIAGSTVGPRGPWSAESGPARPVLNNRPMRG
jgi:hypothetical protein